MLTIDLSFVKVLLFQILFPLSNFMHLLLFFVDFKPHFRLNGWQLICTFSHTLFSLNLFFFLEFYIMFLMFLNAFDDFLFSFLLQLISFLFFTDNLLNLLSKLFFHSLMKKFLLFEFFNIFDFRFKVDFSLLFFLLQLFSLLFQLGFALLTFFC